jgi:hypothetical protein
MKLLLKTCGFAVIIWFALCCLFPDEALGARTAELSESPAKLVSTGSIEQSTASAYCTPEAVAIGEPFTLYLDILHDAKLRVLLDAPAGGGEDDQFGPSWVVLESRRVVRLPLSDGTGRTLTQVRWRMFGVEPGDFEIPVIGADALTSGTVHRVDASVATIQVRPELAEGEDAPRPMVGFQPPPPAEDSPLGTIGLVVLGTVAFLFLTLLVLLVRWALWRKDAPAAKQAPSPESQLAQLDPSDESAARELHYSLAQLTRLALGGKGRQTHAGQTDEEWVQSLREAGPLPQTLVDRTELLLAKCAEVKYGASTPTRWATTEAWEEARAICAEAKSASSGAEGSSIVERENAEVQA